MMEYKKISYLVITNLIVSIFILSCAGNKITTNEKRSTPFSPSLSPAYTATEKPSIADSMLLTPTWEPTLSKKNETSLFEMLHDKTCTLPCYLGITPGKTSLKSAMDILKQLGVNDYKIYTRASDGAVYYDFTLHIGATSDETQKGNMSTSPILIFHHVDLITKNDIVEIIEIGISTLDTDESKALYREMWSNYLLSEIFLQLGAPDNLYIQTEDPLAVYFGSYLLIEYKRLGINLNLYGSKNDNHLCMKNDAPDIYERIDLYNKNSDISIYSDQRVPPTDRNVWLPIEETLGIGAHEFYSLIIQYPTICFMPMKVSP